MPGSVAVAVRSAVVAGLSDAFADDDGFNGNGRAEQRVEVAYGYDRASNAAERVFTDRARAETPPAALRASRNVRQESGEFEVVVLVAGVGMSPEETDQRAFDVLEVVEDWLADRKSNELGVTGLQTLTARGWDCTNLGNDRGHMSEIRLRVAWTARLT